MNIDWVKKVWNDPVWSKVIATGIIFLCSSIFALLTFILLFFWQKFNPDHVRNLFEFSRNYFSESTSVNNLIVWLFGVFFLSLALTVFYFVFLPKLKKNTLATPIGSFEKQLLPDFNFNNTASFFDYRIGRAFPGVRGLVWLDSPDEALKRIEILLSDPLVFQGSNYVTNSRLEPLWWFRGFSSNSIESFSIVKQGILRPKHIRINIDEYIISKLAVYSASSYYRSFVYVETKPSEPSGANKISKEEIQNGIKKWGYYNEEFATVDGKVISRAEYDDGAAVINGKVIETSNAILVSRYLSTYNFIITGQESPFNVLEHQKEQTEMLNSILRGEASVEDLVNHVTSIKKSQIIKYI